MSASRARLQPIRFGGVVHRTAAAVFDKDGVLFDHGALLTQLHAGRRDLLRRRYGAKVAASYDERVGVRSPDAAADRASATAGAEQIGPIDPDGPLAMATAAEEVVVLAGLLYEATAAPWLQCVALARAIFAEADEAVDLTRIPPLPGFPQTLVDLKAAGVVVGIVTSDWRARTCRQLGPYRLEGVLDFLAAGDDAAGSKPEARVLELRLSEVGVAPADAVVIGDTANDWLLARRAGAKVVAVGRAAGSSAGPPSDVLTVISSIAEIAPAHTTVATRESGAPSMRSCDESRAKEAAT